MMQNDIYYGIGRIRIGEYLFGPNMGERKVTNLLCKSCLGPKLALEVHRLVAVMIPKLMIKATYEVRIKGDMLEIGPVGTPHRVQLSEAAHPHLTIIEIGLLRQVVNDESMFKLGFRSEVEIWREAFFGKLNNTTPHEE